MIAVTLSHRHPIGGVEMCARKPRFFAALFVSAIIALSFSRFSPGADELGGPPATLAVLKGHTEPVYAISFTPDGKYVITGSFDRTLKMWEAATGTDVKTFGGQAGHQNLVLSLALTADGQLLASGSN